MVWVRYDDTFHQRPVWDGVSYEARWHYQCLVEECSRTERWDGELPLTRALRASDVSDPEGCLAELEAIGYVTVTRNGDATSAVTGDAVTVTVTRIKEHVPPKSIRNNAADSAVRMRRYRAHKQGKHHLCLPKNCPDAPAENATRPPDDTGRVTRNPGTGLNQSSRERSDAPTDTDGRASQSGLVGGPGGGVTRNAAAAAADTGPDGDAVQDRRAIRTLCRDWHLPEEIAAWVVRQVRQDARDRGIPIRTMTRYLARMAENDDLADYVGAALDHFDRLDRDSAEASPEPPGLRLIEDPRARRAAINACRRCDNNGMTLDDRPSRCDHKGPSQLPLHLQPVDDQDTDPAPAEQAPAAVTAAEAAPPSTTGPADPTRRDRARRSDGSFDPHHPETPLQEAHRILDALPEHVRAYYRSRAQMDLRRSRQAVTEDQVVLAAAAHARRSLIA